ERLADARRSAGDQTVRRDFGARRDDGPGSDHRAMTDAYAVEDGALDADEAARFHVTRVQHHAVSDHHVVFDDRGIAVAEVHDRTILNVGAPTEDDTIDVPSQDASVPDAALGLQMHVADEGRPRGDVDVFVDLGDRGAVALQNDTGEPQAQGDELRFESIDILGRSVPAFDGVDDRG